MRTHLARSTVGLVLLALPATAAAQPLGTFRWQLQPYCNVITVTITQVGGTFRLEGTDDLCGAPKAASALGTAAMNPDGSVGFGLTIVAPAGASVHVSASVALPALGGTWRDSQGGSGTFAFVPGAGTGGSPRPAVGTAFAGIRVGTGLRLATAAGPGAEPAPLLTIDTQALFRAVTMRSTDYNLAIGASALATAGDGVFDNVALGPGALQSLRDSLFSAYNVAVGARAATASIESVGTVAVGYEALASHPGGYGNIAIGASALRNATSGSYNVVVGHAALHAASVGDRNLAIGGSNGPPNTLGSNNILVGYGAGTQAPPGSSNNIFIGNVGAGLDQNTIRIGNTTHTGGTVIGGIAGLNVSGAAVYITSGGRLGVSGSSARFKDDIVPVPDDAVARLQALRPVRFTYKPGHDHGGRTPQYGLVAEDVAGTMPDLVIPGEDGRPWTVRYHFLAPLLLADAQRLERERQALQARVDTLERERAELAARLDAIERALGDASQRQSPATVKPAQK